MTRYLVFRNERDQQVLRSWWERLKDNRAWRAELSRAGSPEDVLLSKGFRILYYELAGSQWVEDSNLLGLAAVAGTIVHVRDNIERYSFAESCATPVDGRSPVSELRFSQLQKSNVLEELLMRMRRAIQLLGRKANIISIADSILHWYMEMVRGRPEAEARNRIRVRWGMDYFQKAPVNTEQAQ